MDYILPCAAGSGNGACGTFRPHLDILCGVADDRLLARCAGRSMYPYKLALRDGEKPEGVIVAQVGLYGKRQLGYILYTADIAGLYAKRIEFRRIR